MANHQDIYTHGHHESVLQSHKWRTVENSARFLITHLKPDSILLDAGCGPGNISAGLSKLIPDGKVIGIDYSSNIIATAQKDFDLPDYKNLKFRQGDIYSLEFPNDSFDVVYTHQVLQHLNNPVAAIKELCRVLKPGGILAAREADYDAFTWYPQLPELDRWRVLYRAVTLKNKAEYNGGRFLKAWVMQAGLELIDISCTTWVFSSDKDRQWWGNSWSKRTTESDFGKQALEYGLIDAKELRQISDAFIEWSKDSQGIWTIPSMEVIAKKSLL